MCVCIWKSKDKLMDSVLSFHLYEGGRDSDYQACTHSKHCYLLSHLNSLSFNSPISLTVKNFLA